MRSVLDEWQLDRNVQRQFLTGRRVELAEELKAGVHALALETRPPET